jgi:ABC-type uncharacterized transport system auxiliary subunit
MKRALPLGLSLILWCCGCVSLERSYPDKRFFVIEISERAVPASAPGERSLSVANFRISPRYADKSFVYRISEAGYEADFYNQFLTATDIMIGEEVRKGLAASGLFKYVVGPSNQLQPNYVLEGSINSLYGDFQNLNAPAAVMEVEFFLHREQADNPGLVMQKRYLKSVPLSSRSADALVKGWDQALEGILAELISDLKAAKL